MYENLQKSPIDKISSGQTTLRNITNYLEQSLR